jgi:hypothetical protein
VDFPYELQNLPAPSEKYILIAGPELVAAYNTIEVLLICLIDTKLFPLKKQSFFSAIIKAIFIE